jgi:hypothetical protein
MPISFSFPISLPLKELKQKKEIPHEMLFSISGNRKRILKRSALFSNYTGF